MILNHPFRPPQLLSLLALLNIPIIGAANAAREGDITIATIVTQDAVCPDCPGGRGTKITYEIAMAENSENGAANDFHVATNDAVHGNFKCPTVEAFEGGMWVNKPVNVPGEWTFSHASQIENAVNRHYASWWESGNEITQGERWRFSFVYCGAARRDDTLEWILTINGGELPDPPQGGNRLDVPDSPPGSGTDDPGWFGADLVSEGAGFAICPRDGGIAPPPGSPISTRREEGTAPTLQEPRRWDGPQPASILLIQDQPGWGLDSHQQILNACGIPYDVINSAQIAVSDFSSYDKIITTGQQPDNYYYAIQANVAKFESYLATGGCCAFEIANYFGGANEFIVWPGGFTAITSIGSNEVCIDAHTDCLTYDVSEEELKNWNYSSHGIVGNQPPGYVSLVSEPDGSTAGMFPWESGTAYIAHQPLEWAWAFGYSLNYPRNFDCCECPSRPVPIEKVSWGRMKMLYK